MSALYAVIATLVKLISAMAIIDGPYAEIVNRVALFAEHIVERWVDDAEG